MHSKSRTRIVRTIVMSAALTLLGALSASAQTVNQYRPYSGTAYNPCNGESVVFSGTIHIHEKTQISSDGRIHFVANENFSVSGRGQSTGVTYNINGNMHTNSKFPSFPITFRQRSRFVSTGYAPSFHATFAFHVNGNGIQTQVSTTSDCNG